MAPTKQLASRCVMDPVQVLESVPCYLMIHSGSTFMTLPSSTAVLKHVMKFANNATMHDTGRIALRHWLVEGVTVIEVLLGTCEVLGSTFNVSIFIIRGS